MGILEIASGASCLRGLDYYKSKKVKKLKKINDNEYESIISGQRDYNVYLNIEHPRKSTCNCPFANGKRIICKHIVATYFKAIPNSAKNFEEEQNKLQKEYEQEQNEVFDNAIKYLSKMTKKELIDEMIFVFNFGPEWIYNDFVKRNGIR